MPSKNDKPAVAAASSGNLSERFAPLVLVLIFLGAAGYVGYQIWNAVQPAPIALSTPAPAAASSSASLLKLNKPSYQRIAPTITPDPNMGKSNPFVP